jgi:hypothetical protein
MTSVKYSVQTIKETHMGFGDLALLVGILAWTQLEFRKRAQQHRENMAFLARGEQPPDRTPAPEAWRLITVGLTGVTLLATVIMMSTMSFHRGQFLPPILYVVLFFFMLFLLVTRMFFRDLTIYRTWHRKHTEEIQ